jgi:hypothetical protein
MSVSVKWVLYIRFRGMCCFEMEVLRTIDAVLSVIHVGSNGGDEWERKNAQDWTLAKTRRDEGVARERVGANDPTIQGYVVAFRNAYTGVGAMPIYFDYDDRSDTIYITLFVSSSKCYFYVGSNRYENTSRPNWWFQDENWELEDAATNRSYLRFRVFRQQRSLGSVSFELLRTGSG